MMEPLCWQWSNCFSRPFVLSTPGLGLTLFSKNGKRKTTFSTQVDSSRLYTWTEDGQKIQKKTQGTIVLHFESTTGQQHQDLQILYALGSNSQPKFDCSKFLRSTQTDTEYVLLLHRLSRNMGEPHRSRAQHIYPTLEQDTEDCPELRYFASHSILSVGTNSPHFDTCIPSWIATSSDSRFSRIIGQYWWKTSHKQTQIRRWEIAECVSPSISFERSIALCWKLLPRRGPVCVCVSCYNKQAVTGQLLIREMQGDRALWCYSVQRSYASEREASTGHGCVPADMF